MQNKRQDKIFEYLRLKKRKKYRANNYGNIQIYKASFTIPLGAKNIFGFKIKCLKVSMHRSKYCMYVFFLTVFCSDEMPTVKL